MSKHLKLWEYPSNYSGETWSGYYVFLGRNRDSDALTNSNFETALAAVQAVAMDGEEETVIPVRESHWAVGWVEWIAIHQDDTAALAAAEAIMERLSDYPVLDENDWSERETEEAGEVWRNCYNEKERVQYIREHRSQFEFSDMSDLLGCVRGKYFAGYASELIGH